MAPPSKRQRGTFEGISRLTLPSPLHILHGTETMHLPVGSLMFLLNTTLLARDCSYRRMKRRDQGGQTWVNGSNIVRERLPFTYDRCSWLCVFYYTVTMDALARVGLITPHHSEP